MHEADQHSSALLPKTCLDSSLRRRNTAIDVDDLAGHVAAGCGGKGDHLADDLKRVAAKYLQQRNRTVGTLTNVPAGGIASVVISGKVDQERLDLSQTINFDNKTAALATWSVTKDTPIF